MPTELPEATLRFLRERHPEVVELALWVREAVLRAEPDLSERVYEGWDGIGFRHPDGGYVCGVFPQADHVRLLFEHGARLDDPEGRLRGAGSRTRYLEVAATGDSLREEIERLVREGVAERLFRAPGT